MGASRIDPEIAAARLLALRQAREHMIPFMRLMMPDPNEPDDPAFSLFQVTALAKLLTDILEKVARGELLRIAISVAPQHGKSLLTSVGFPAWVVGMFPWVQLILGTYSQDFAETWGEKVRTIITAPTYSKVFPRTILKKGSKAKSTLGFDGGGQLSFVGRGGATTGKPADIFICDDPIKDNVEAQSPTILKQVWDWFNSVVFTRCHSASAVVLVHTRWNQDDPIGRLVDPEHPDHDPEIAKLWTYINIPAVITDKRQDLADALGLPLTIQSDLEIQHQFGARPMTALWPGRKDLRFLAEAKRLDKRVFSALYMGSPTPEDGDYFKRADLVLYNSPDELPTNLSMYAASDHALSSREDRDASCMGLFGMDVKGGLWVLPDLYWERESDTSKLVDQMIVMMLAHHPQVWWAEREHISKSIRPFLMKRMLEEPKTLSTLVDDSLVSTVDLKARARSIQGLIAMRRVHFPAFAPWWPDALAQMLRFPQGANDDFVSFLSLIGRGILREMKPARPAEAEKIVRVGSIQWIKAQAARERAHEERAKARGGM